MFLSVHMKFAGYVFQFRLTCLLRLSAYVNRSLPSERYVLQRQLHV